MKPARLLAPVTVIAIAVAACTDDEPGDEPTEQPDATLTTPSPPRTPVPEETEPDAEEDDEDEVSGPVSPDEIDDVATGLDAPWSIAFVPGGEDALVSQRDDATIVLVSADGDLTEAGEVPGVDSAEEGGLLGLAFEPDTSDTLYAYATMEGENQVLRASFDGESLGEFETMLDGIPANPFHNGGRLAFGPDGMLYVSTGDAGDPGAAQDEDSLAGKILRLTPDGDVPDDNPSDGSPVYSYGHRNVQGLAFDDDGQLWASEFGPDTVDELNLIEPGGNYGWPEVEGIAGDDRFIDPVHEWPVEEASPSGVAYVADTLFLASLRGSRLWQVPVSDGEIDEPTAYVEDHGRLRDAVVAPDGSLWVLTNNTDGRGDPRDGDDRILRLTLS